MKVSKAICAILTLIGLGFLVLGGGAVWNPDGSVARWHHRKIVPLEKIFPKNLEGSMTPNLGRQKNWRKFGARVS